MEQESKNPKNPVRELLSALRAAGFVLRVDAGKLIVSPKGRITPEWRCAILNHRDVLLSLLTQEAAAEAVVPFLGLPPPDDPSWIHAEAYREFWAGLDHHNAHLPDGVASRTIRPRVRRATSAGGAPPRKASGKPAAPLTIFGNAGGD